MKRIYKYHLPFGDVTTIQMPKDAQILSVGNQNEGVFVWALVDPKAELTDYQFRMAGTGHPILPGFDYNFIGTVAVMKMQLIFHIFEMKEN